MNKEEKIYRLIGAMVSVLVIISLVFCINALYNRIDNYGCFDNMLNENFDHACDDFGQFHMGLIAIIMAHAIIGILIYFLIITIVLGEDYVNKDGI